MKDAAIAIGFIVAMLLLLAVMTYVLIAIITPYLPILMS